MRHSRSTAPAAALAAVLLAGCGTKSATGTVPTGQPAPPVGTSVTASVPGPAPGPIPVGPGPRATYTVQPQPAAGSCHYGADQGEPLEDRACTPGATSPAVTQATIARTICRSGYTKTIRPPVSVTGPEKTANAKSYGYSGSLGVAEYDHLISLELGGDPNSAQNLWVEPPDPGHVGTGVNNKKDPVESKLHTAVCNGKVSLAAAQQAIVQDWTTALSRLGIG
jgi:hypothetical protein